MGMASICRAEIDPVSGIDFVTITAPGNAPWMGSGRPEFDLAIGRGRVDYEYRIGRTEITTAQWVDFMNAVYDRPAGDTLLFYPRQPLAWGAGGTAPINPGGTRWRVAPGNGDKLVGGISWRGAAMYCNWLHNDKRLDAEALQSGVYDVRTFGAVLVNPELNVYAFTDQAARSPGARYFIPTLDEWMKAAHYDPTKLNQDGTRGGWWEYSNGSNTPYVYGPPGVLVNGVPAQANAGWLLDYPGFFPSEVRVGSYPSVTSPWGLLDVAGGISEWTESILTRNIGDKFRYHDSSAFGSSSTVSDRIQSFGGDSPGLDASYLGLRIAAVVPSPITSFPLVAGACVILRRRRRVWRGECAASQRCVWHQSQRSAMPRTTWLSVV
jgi:formylglycine-generating enzyme required for sulfatase activity